MKQELEPIYDRAKSFYKKAHIIKDDDGTIHLISYSTEVLTIRNGKAHIIGFYSMTTLRHIRETLRQHNFKVGSKQELEAMYC